MVDFTAYREVSLKEMLQTGGGAAGGLTVRDYFATAAMSAIASRDETWEGGEDFETDAFSLAMVSYDIADAMMKVRNKRPEEPTPTVEEAFKL